jgi:hypothetical protein
MSSDEVLPSAGAEPLSRRLVLVTGAGRSGTSTIAGALHHLGLHVPLPVLKSNESNPMGFFESTWPLWFHRRLMDMAHIEQTDGRPEAADLMAAAVTPEVRRELAEWMAGVAAEADQLVVKDPRSCWVPWLWAETAAELGIETGFLTMVRHPAEVMGSRSTYYRSNRPGMDDWQFAVMNLCGWINGNLVVERQTRGARRVMVSYEDLLEDWRSCLVKVRDEFDLSFDGDIGGGQRHAVDDFIDPELRRHAPSWEGLDLPAELVEIAQGVFEAMVRLASGDEDVAGTTRELDSLGSRYADLVRRSQAIAHDTTLSAGKLAAAEAVAEYQRRSRGSARLRWVYSRLRRRFR